MTQKQESANKELKIHVVLGKEKRKQNYIKSLDQNYQ